MAIKFNASSELVENYKEMSFLSSEKQILGMCGDDGNRLYSIGDNGKLNLFSESNEHETGWVLTELSKTIEDMVNGSINVKGFSAKKNSDKFHVVAIVNHDDIDELFVSFTVDPTLPEWKKIPFDDDSMIPKGIANVFTCGNNDTFDTIVDVTNASGFLERYFVDCHNELGEDKKWHKHTLDVNYDKTLTSCMGKKNKEEVPGIYTFGTLGDVQQVIYTPIYNFIDPSRDPMPTKIDLPVKLDAMTTYERPDGYTDLFMCGSGKLYICPYDEQKNKAEPIFIGESDYFNHVREFYAYLSSSYNLVYVWGRNDSGDVFYCHCDPDKLTDISYWSIVYEYLNDAIYFNAYYSEITKCSSSIACTQHKDIKLGIQSPDTSAWRKSSIGLPSGNETKKFNSYTTKINVTDEYGEPLCNKDVWIESKDYYSVYINNVYHSLDKTPLRVKTDASGAIKIVSQTDSLYSYEFYIYENEGAEDSDKTEISAWAKPTDKILSLQSADDIRKAQIVTGDGKSTPLVDQSLSDSDLNSVAEAMIEMSKAKEDLLTPGNVSKYRNGTLSGVFVTVAPGKITTSRDEEAIKKAIEHKMLKGATINPDGTLSIDRLMVNRTGIFDGIGDFFSDVINELKNIGETIWHYFITFVDEAWHFIVQIGEEIYSFILDCADAILSGLEVIWNAIKVAVTALVEFIKFIFNFDDIAKTANVIKHLFNLQLDYSELIVDEIKGKVQGIVEELEKGIDDWANITDVKGLDNKTFNQINDDKSQYNDSSVSSMYLADHLADNITNVDMNSVRIPNVMSADNDDAENAFIDFIKDQAEIFEQLFKDMSKVLSEDAVNTDFITLTKKILALFADTVLESVENAIDLVLNLAKESIEAVRSMLYTELRIPVLSNILEDWFGIKPFSIMDILSYVIAVPANIIYKVITQKPLFTDEQYEQIMALEAKSIGSIELPTIPDSLRNVIYVVGHIGGGMVGLIEAILYPVVALLEEAEAKIPGYIDTGLAVISSGMIAIGDVAYKPYDRDKVTTYLPYVTKYIPLAIKVGAGFKGKAGLEKGGSIFYGIGCGVDMICKIINIVETAKSKSGAEESAGIVSLSGYACGDISTILDQVVKYDKEPDSKLVFIVIREVFAGSAVVLQVTSGIIVEANDLPVLPYKNAVS